jgi:hypothetical protein
MARDGAVSEVTGFWICDRGSILALMSIPVMGTAQVHWQCLMEVSFSVQEQSKQESNHIFISAEI